MARWVLVAASEQAVLPETIAVVDSQDRRIATDHGQGADEPHPRRSSDAGPVGAAFLMLRPAP
ncbi:hypothetical protein ACFQVC_23405 [Streptomyces monticola]|uniref:Uncharacterized protein n=1 Tax=Streptomyces monticola TaxID=2666263 RepID=A0ABW2JP21_9ACTN